MLLALLALVRCAADPVPLEYYYVPLVVAVATWECAVVRRSPVLALLTTFALQATFQIGTRQPSAVLNGMSLAWMCILGLYLGRSLLAIPSSDERRSAAAVSSADAACR